MDPIITSALIGAGANLIGGIGQKKREKRSFNNQVKLMGIQQGNQMELNKQGHELQMKAWNDTNYGAQINHMKSAGLNPGMIYGGSGAGGATMGNQGGGSAASGSAPTPQPMEIGSMLQSAAQVALLKAQEENIKAQTAKLKTGATGEDIENQLKGAGLSNKIKEEEVRAELERRKKEGDVSVQLGKNDHGKVWNNGEVLTRYEHAEMEKLKGVSKENLLKDAQIGLQKATASNLISNDELIQLQTDLMSAQMGMINSEGFQKLPKALQGILLMLAKKFGGL